MYNINISKRKNFNIKQKVERFHTIEATSRGIWYKWSWNKIENKNPAISAVKSKRKDPFEISKNSMGIPGIGTYNIRKGEKKGVYIEGKKQRFETSYNGRPGVGEYNINLSNYLRLKIV